MKPSPLDREVVVAVGLGGDVLPQLAGGQAGPQRVVAAAGHPVATLAALAARHQLVGRQVGHGVREGAQEAVEEMAYGRREGRQLHALVGGGNAELNKRRLFPVVEERHAGWGGGYLPAGTS